jgi:hypothetical protein
MSTTCVFVVYRTRTGIHVMATSQIPPTDLCRRFPVANETVVRTDTQKSPALDTATHSR